MIARTRRFTQLWRTFGPRWLGYRTAYALRQRAGLVRRGLPVTIWSQQLLKDFLTDTTLANAEAYHLYRQEQAPPFFFTPDQLLAFQPLLQAFDSEFISPLQVSKALAEGKVQFFEHSFLDVGVPPDWHRNALTGALAPSTQHWSQIPDFGFGDIKVIWEPSRFGFTYALVRAYWRTGDEQYAELFWQLVEDWRVQNPPQQGPNWKCGQETTFRVMAWVFGMYGFGDAAATTARRVALLAQMIAVSGHRIESNLGYALSQRNNHGISEGVGLWTIGLLFPELQRAEAWRKRGREVLEELGRDLIYDDGSFVQHSVNYHRLMLHDYLWTLRLGQLHDQTFSNELQERVAQAGQFLYQLQDAGSGQVPYYGQNDGALILPLNNCDYLDFRPVIQATHYQATGKRQYDSGPWDEDLMWLFGSEAISSPTEPMPRADLQAESGGYYTLRSKEGFAFIRCATYRDRPGQADMLHFDLWWRGQNIATDAGTYSYNASPPWDNPLAHSIYHNTVTVDGEDQMDRVGKFLWLPWLHSEVLQDRRSVKGHLSYWEGEHDGYQRLLDPVTHRRGILRVAGDIWLVLDELEGAHDHEFRLHWLFPDWPYTWKSDAGQLQLQTTQGAYHVQALTTTTKVESSLVRAAQNTPRGWLSPYYSHRAPALSLALTTQASSAMFATLFSPQTRGMEVDGTELSLSMADRDIFVSLKPGESDALVASIELFGDVTDSLLIN